MSVLVHRLREARHVVVEAPSTLSFFIFLPPHLGSYYRNRQDEGRVHQLGSFTLCCFFFLLDLLFYQNQKKLCCLKFRGFFYRAVRKTLVIGFDGCKNA